MTETPSSDVPATESLQGCVKWFNNKQGYGFVSVTTKDSDVEGMDLFVHHSAIQVSKEQYRYLVQGEYIEFVKVRADQGNHEWQAGNVRGLNNGKLMCETRHDSRTQRLQRSDHDVSSGNNVRPRGNGPRDNNRGPRDRSNNKEEWLVVKRRVSGSNSRGDERGTTR